MQILVNVATFQEGRRAREGESTNPRHSRGIAEESLFQSDECHRESDIDDSIPCNCVRTLEDVFSKVTNVSENWTSTTQFPVAVFTL